MVSTSTARIAQPEQETGRTWELFEDAGGFLRIQPETSGDITHIFTDDGVLLTGSAENPSTGVADSYAPTPAGGRLGRLLRYYVGSGGRRVVLHTRDGTQWTGRIIGTRWISNRAGRSWSFLARPQDSSAYKQDKEA